MKSTSEKALLRLNLALIPLFHRNNQSHTYNSFSRIIARMALDYHAVLGTDLFTFLLGPQEKPLRIHEGLVKQLSQPLYAMMTNGMKESVDRKAKLDDVDPQTFAFFAEYAYSGAYRLTPSGEQSGDLDGSAQASQKYNPEYCKKCGSNYSVSCRPESCVSTGAAYSQCPSQYCTYCGAYGRDARCRSCLELRTTGESFYRATILYQRHAAPGTSHLSKGAQPS